jgi:hypothetical protein
MSSTEIAVQTTTIADQMEFARMVVAQPSGGAMSILPESYRGNPANVLIAVGLGASMGLSPAESLYRISVIKGKPTAGAELIASNVRKAGHRLRVRGDDASCTATIIRADDPDYEFTITRDLEWARSMKLADNDNYRKQPGTMLQWRAITAVARLACPESLYGVVYSDEEADEITVTSQPVRVSVAEILKKSGAETANVDVLPASMPASNMEFQSENDDARGSSRADFAPGTDEKVSESDEKTEEKLPIRDEISAGQIKAMGALMGSIGLTDRQKALVFCADVIGHEINSRNDLSKDEAGRVIDALSKIAPESEGAE